MLGILFSRKKAEFEKLLHDLKVGVLGQMFRFAAEVAEEIDSFAARGLFGLSSESYPRHFANGPPKTSTTHVNQLLIRRGTEFLLACDRPTFVPPK